MGYSMGTPCLHSYFVLAMMHLPMLLKRENIGYKLGKDQRLINHLLFMDEVKLYARPQVKRSWRV